MLFGLFFAIAIILILLRVVTWVIGLGYVFAVIVDMLILGGFAIYYAHYEWFLHISSGKAVYFWDVVLFVFVSVIYGVIVMLGTSKFPRISGLFHYVIAWVTTGFIYLFINYEVFGKFGPLLNNEQMNTVVHLFIISILALFIFSTRMRIFKKI